MYTQGGRLGHLPLHICVDEIQVGIFHRATWAGVRLLVEGVPGVRAGLGVLA